MGRPEGGLGESLVVHPEVAAARVAEHLVAG